MRKAAALGFMMLVCGSPAFGQQVRFTGTTSADPILIRDALQQLARHAYAAEGCSSLTEVSSEILPESFEPGPTYRVAAKGVRYERWNATLCGRSVSYLFGYWPSPEGGSLFQVSHPFPEGEQGSPPKRQP